MLNYKIILEYDGSSFQGWHQQKNQASISQELLKTLAIILPSPVNEIFASGRTDSGVHARGQVANFHYPDNLDLQALALSISSLLRGRVAVIGIEIVPDDFHARYSAIGKTYSYQILNRAAPPTINRNQVWHVPQKLNLELMQLQSKDLIGEHDFTSFRASNCEAKSAIRTITEINFQVNGDLIRIEVSGEGFLKQMVRNIVGTLVDFGMGSSRLKNSSIKQILDSKDRHLAGQTAPAEGLCLEQVFY